VATPPMSRVDQERLFRKRCSTCHAPARVYHRNASKDEWREIVDRMRRMPHSGIAPEEGRIILDYLVSLREKRTAGRKSGKTTKGDWLSVLETTIVRDNRVRIGGNSYDVSTDGKAVTLTRDGEKHVIGPDRSARVNAWRIGKLTYELHLILYESRRARVRLGLAMRRIGMIK
jgi:hypothetical protein